MNQTKTPKDKLLLGIGISLAVVLLAVVIVSAVIIYNVGVAFITPLLVGEPEETLPPQPANLYAPEDFVMEDGYMSLTAGDYMLGIDVSEWNGNIDWKKVKEAGIEFV